MPPPNNTAADPGPGRWARAGWWLLAHLFLGLAIAGVILPLVPATPFAMLAAACAAKASPAVQKRILHHRLVGPVITRWREDRTVSRPTKVTAAVSMVVSAVLAWAFAPPIGAAVATAIMAVAGTWLATRPEPSAEPVAQGTEGAL